MRYDAGKWKCWQKRNLDLLPGNLSPYFPPFSSLSHLSFSPTHSFPIFPSPSHPFPIFPSLPPFPSLPHIYPPLPFLQLFPSWRSPPQGLVRISNKGRHYTAANLRLQLKTNFFQLQKPLMLHSEAKINMKQLKTVCSNYYWRLLIVKWELSQGWNNVRTSRF